MTNRRTERLFIRASEEEKAQMEAYASDCSMAVSSYVRAMALGERPASTLDAQAMERINRHCADLGRLGGLLKLLLVSKLKTTEAGSHAEQDVRRTLRGIERAQGDLRSLLAQLRRGD